MAARSSRNGCTTSKSVGITAGRLGARGDGADVINALRQIAPVEVSTLPGQDENIEFRVPVELLDVTGAKNISKDSNLGHSPSAEAVCR